MENNNIEDGIIGCILVDPDCLYEIYDKITPDMFTSNFCKRVYEAALSFYDRGKTYDATILANEVATEKSDSQVYMKQFADLVMATPSSVLIKSYAENLIANYQTRRLSLLLKQVDLNPKNIKDTIGTLITRLEEIQTNTKQRSRSLKEIVGSYKGDYFTEKEKKNVLKVSTGLDKFDECVPLVGGDVYVVGARPSVGKSAFVTQIAKAIGKAGYKVGYFNLEMSDSQIYERLVAAESGIDLQRIKNATRFLGEEEEKFNKANEELEKLNLYIYTGGMTDLDIKAKCRHQNFNVIIIDYLQLIEYHDRCESRRVEVGRISRAIKMLAMELNVPIIVLSQLSRKTENTADKEPTMADLRETGDIEQDASTIILLWNLRDEEEYKEFKGLKVDKNRQGKLFSEPLDFLGDKMTFVETKETLAEVKQMLETNAPSSKSDDNPFCN